MSFDPDFDDGTGGKIARSKGPMIAAWIVVFGANLPVPLLLSLIIIRKTGVWGMVVAVLLMLTLGAFAVSWSRRVGLAVVVGGWIVAALQLLPYLQFYAGIFSVSVAMGPGKEVDSGFEDEMGGFVATSLTGGILITVALAIGAALLMVRALFTRAGGEDHAKPMKYRTLDF